MREDINDDARQRIERMARRMAPRDPDGRTAEELAAFMTERVTIASDGRPCIDADLAAQLPCPYD